MKFVETKIPGCFTIDPSIFNDNRGIFVKTFRCEEFINHGLEHVFKENYYTLSKKDVIRGLHFQLPPYDHAKVVSTMKGAAIDVILDLRRDSPTFKHHITVELSEDNHKLIYIPRGCAHGFITLVDDTCMSYLQTSDYSQESDVGILFTSLAIDYKIDSPIISNRDLSFPQLEQFESPF